MNVSKNNNNNNNSSARVRKHDLIPVFARVRWFYVFLIITALRAFSFIGNNENTVLNTKFYE